MVYKILDEKNIFYTEGLQRSTGYELRVKLPKKYFEDYALKIATLYFDLVLEKTNMGKEICEGLIIEDFNYPPNDEPLKLGEVRLTGKRECQLKRSIRRFGRKYLKLEIKEVD